MTRIFFFVLFALGGVAFIGSCKNPAAPREPNKFASQATFLRRLDSIRVDNTTILLSSGSMRNALSLPSGDLLFVGEVRPPSQLFSQAFVIRTNALGGVRWARLYTDSIQTLNSIIPIGNGEFIASGSIFSGFNQTSGYALRLDSLGNVRWARAFADEARSARFTGSVLLDPNRLLLYGQTRRTLSTGFSLFINDGFVVACDLIGNILFQRRLRTLGSFSNTAGADIGFNSGLQVSGGAILAGYYTPIFDFVKAGIRRLVAPDLYLLRFNANGDSTAALLYDAQYPAGDVLDQSVSFNGKLTTADEAISIAPMPDGNYAVYARTNSTFYVLIVNASLTGILRQFPLPSSATYSLSEMTIGRDGSFVFVGTSTEKITFEGNRSPAPGGRDVYIAKYSAQGARLWEITQGTSLDDVGFSIRETIDGGFVITGESNSKPLLLKVDERGLLAD
jgi:hypothetical protein